MDNPEKLATRRKQTKQKYNIICVGQHNTQANTNNINRTLLQTTGVKTNQSLFLCLTATLLSIMFYDHETFKRDVCLMLQKHPIRIMYILDTVYWLSVFFSSLT
jgi:hypothetical protein